MKKIWIALTLLALVGLGACQNRDVQPSNGQTTISDKFAQVPEVVVKAVQRAYPTATDLVFSELDKGKVWDSRFSVDLVAHQAKVDAKGTILEEYALKTTVGKWGETLPAAAQEYIRKTHIGFDVIAVGEGQTNSQKSFKVLLRNGKEEITLIFDEKGGLLLEYKAAATPTTNPDQPKNYPIAKVEDLPAAVVQYLTDNGLTFGKGLVTLDKDGKKGYFMLATKGEVVYELTFDANGTLLKATSFTPQPGPKTDQKSFASAKDLPTLITDHLNATYKAWTFLKGYVMVEGGKPLKYLIVVQEGKDFYEVYFNGEGGFESARKQ